MDWFIPSSVNTQNGLGSFILKLLTWYEILVDWIEFTRIPEENENFTSNGILRKRIRLWLTLFFITSVDAVIQKTSFCIRRHIYDYFLFERRRKCVIESGAILYIKKVLDLVNIIYLASLVVWETWVWKKGEGICRKELQLAQFPKVKLG